MNYRFYTFDEPLLNFFFYGTSFYTDERREYVKKWIKFMHCDQDPNNCDAQLSDEDADDGYYVLWGYAITLCQLGLCEPIVKDDKIVGYHANREFYKRMVCFDEVFADFNPEAVTECSNYVKKQLLSWSRQR